MREITLQGAAWQVKGFWPWVPIKSVSMELGQELLGICEWLPATVPGGVHDDLYRAGLIPHPYQDLNSLQCEWVENRWWMYRTMLEPVADPGHKVELVFKGLDYEAIVYVDGVRLGEHKGMFTEAVFDLTPRLRPEPMELTVLLLHAPDEMGQIGKTSETFTQKSRFNYKWDFSTRLVNIGIWDEVVLRVQQRCKLDDVRLATEVEDADRIAEGGHVGLICIEASVASTGGGEDAGRIAKESLGGLARTEASVASTGGRTEAGVAATEDGEPMGGSGGSRTAGADGAAERLVLRALCSSPDGQLLHAETVRVRCGERVRVDLRLPAAQLWYPNGYGEQPLYTVKLELIAEDGELLDEQTCRTGIRKLAYLANDDSPADALPYTVQINNRRIYIRGVNLAPLDHLYGNVLDSQYDRIVYMMKQANMNLVRVWGGGLIERTRLYEQCDRHGILIWQEFIQSSSGVDNLPSQQPEFLTLLREVAVAALKGRRNYVSLTVWSGGNELMSAPNKPSTFDDPNLAMLRELVQRHDPQRLCLPTSASGPVQYITEEKGMGHDVHGHWKYQDNPKHYKLYGDNDNLFHSEFGVDGVSSVKSLRKFLSERYLRPVSMQECIVWRHHGEWWDTLARDERLFGELSELGTFAAASQWVQAEGLRYILEANRRRKFRNSGSVIWQLSEPWPNVSCTNLLDYYGETKMSYYWTKQAFAPIHVSLDYRTLQVERGETVSHDIYLHSHDPDIPVEILVEVVDALGRVCATERYEAYTAEDRAALVGAMTWTMPTDGHELMLVRIAYRWQGGSVDSYPYIFSAAADERLYRSALALETPRLAASLLADWQATPGAESELLESELLIRNLGPAAALHVHAEEITDQYLLEADELYVTLLPGESRTIRVRCERKRAGGFLRPEPTRGGLPLPQLVVRSFNGGEIPARMPGREE